MVGGKQTMDGELSISFSRDFFERHLHGKILFTKEGRTNLSISFSRDFFERKSGEEGYEVVEGVYASFYLFFKRFL